MEDTGKPRASWLWYGAEILTIFFALAVLTGRVYAQSYWGVFGLPPEVISTNFVDYAIMSPNAALACVIIAISTVVVIALIRQKPPYFKSDSNPWVIYFAGGAAFLGGVFIICIIPRVDLSAWIPGTAGLALGLGYLSCWGDM